ncbi:hypothetical protein [Tsukamurella pseudospumae]|uniref:Uncharacterized protein n=1 Tax=Tsukamurella pseudospumae TaxID=239498 RepID=A0A138AEH0_9ACTN|nr:hypothetical protein [Tsukamurella pseudospumae]KXP08810.1 hypothetical protein AXK60_09100 [Tsukamurella pseudospumae]
MAYVIQFERGGWLGKDKWWVGHYAPDGEWIVHSCNFSQEEAEDEVNLLNGGNAAAIRQQAQAQATDHLAAETARAAAAEREAANLAEQQRLLAEQAHRQERERAAWLAAQEADRRRAQEQAAEQLRLYPPTETKAVGGVAAWDGSIAFHLSNGEMVLLSVKEIS